MRSAKVPEKLQKFHQHYLSSLEAQIPFYEEYAKAKISNPSLGLSGMLQNPYVQKANSELLTAYAEIQGIYPDLDEETLYAINRRLCHSDVI